MQILGNKQVLKHFIEQQRALDKGEKPPYTIAQIVLGGGVAGAIGAGMCEALAEYAPDAPDVCAGVSVGAVLQFAFLSKRMRIARSVFGALPWNEFIRGRFWNKRMEIEQVINVLREVGDSRMRAHRADYVVYVTEFKTGKAFAVDVKKTPDPFEALKAAIMVPGFCKGPMNLEDKEVADGAFGMPLPIRHVVKEYRPTDILIIFNRPLPEKISWLEWHLFPLLSRIYLKFRGVPKSFGERVAMMDRVLSDEIYLLTRRKAATWSEFFWGLFLKTERPPPRERKKIRWCIVAPEPHEAISQMSTDRATVRRATDRSYAFMKKLLQEMEAEIRE